MIKTREHSQDKEVIELKKLLNSEKMRGLDLEERSRSIVD